jgi:Kef-type K+ transport system membrane component KefB
MGAHAFVGPFLLGVGLSAGDQVTPLSAPLRPLGILTRRVCGPIFFVSMGLTVNLASHFSLQLALVVLLVACATKLASVQLAGRLLGYGPKASLLMATAMNARGAVGIDQRQLLLQLGDNYSCRVRSMVVGGGVVVVVGV